MDQRLTYLGKSLSREQTSSPISPQHFPIVLTICNSGIPRARGWAFAFNSLHLITSRAQLPLEPPKTFGIEEAHSFVTCCAREVLPFALSPASAGFLMQEPESTEDSQHLVSENQLRGPEPMSPDDLRHSPTGSFPAGRLPRGFDHVSVALLHLRRHPRFYDCQGTAGTGNVTRATHAPLRD